MFNDEHFLQRLESGELTSRIREKGHPSPPRAYEPFCTDSLIIVYLDANGRPVALIHEYRRRDGTRGASGLPDPKWLFHDGTVYTLDMTL